jgi:hypothetical protein
VIALRSCESDMEATSSIVADVLPWSEGCMWGRTQLQNRVCQRSAQSLHTKSFFVREVRLHALRTLRGRTGTQLVELFGMWLGCWARGGEVQDFEALRQL